jgi:hypothetical protein
LRRTGSTGSKKSRILSDEARPTAGERASWPSELWAILLLGAGLSTLDPIAVKADEYREAVESCRPAVARRLDIRDAEVVIKSVSAQSDSSGMVIDWSAPAAAGRCVVRSRTVTDIVIDKLSMRSQPEPLCQLAVAKMLRKRPKDVEVTGADKISTDRYLVSWTSYRGDSGTCNVSEGRVKEINTD